MHQHEIVNCSCGALIGQCRCPQRNKPVRVIEHGCEACKKLFAGAPINPTILPTIPHATHFGKPKQRMRLSEIIAALQAAHESFGDTAAVDILILPGMKASGVGHIKSVQGKVEICSLLVPFV